MKRVLLFTLFFVGNLSLKAQNVGVNEDGSTPDPTAILDIKSTDKGLLVPRTDTATVNAVGTPATSLLIYQSSDNTFYYYNGTAQKFVDLAWGQLVRMVPKNRVYDN